MQLVSTDCSVSVSVNEPLRAWQGGAHATQRARRYFEFDKLRDVTHVVTRNLNKIIDINYYPVETARRSNTRNRPIGIGVQARAAPQPPRPPPLHGQTPP